MVFELPGPPEVSLQIPPGPTPSLRLPIESVYTIYIIFLWSLCNPYGVVCLRVLRGPLHKQLFSTISCRNMDVIIVRPWMLWKSYALVTRTISWFGHGCFRNRTRSYHGLLSWFGHDCFGLKKPRLLNRLYPFLS